MNFKFLGKLQKKKGADTVPKGGVRGITEPEKAEQMYRSVVELAPDSIVTFDVKGVITSCNTAATRMLGYPKGELIGKHFSKIGVFKARDIPKYVKLLNSVVRGKVTKPLEIEFYRKDGTPFLAEVRVGAIKKGGKTMGFQSISRDITERKHTEEELAEKKQFLENIVQGIREGLLLLSKDFKILWANKAILEKTGYKMEEVVGNYCYKVTHHRESPCKPPHDRCPVLEFMEKGRPVTVIHTHFDKKGGKFFVEVSAYPIKNENGEVIRFIHLSRDVTDRKLAEEKVRMSKQFMESLIASMKDGFFVLDKHGVHIDVNPALCQMTGFLREELIGVGPPHPYWPPEEYKNIKKAFRKTLSGKFEDFELTFMRKNGERFSVIVSPSWIKDKQRNVISYFATVKDITERKKAEEEIKESEGKFRSIFEGVNDVIVYVDKYGKIINVNKRVEDVLGYKRDDIIGKNFVKLGILSLQNIPKTVKLFKDSVTGDKVISLLELGLEDKNGNIVPIEVSTKIIKKNGKIEGTIDILRDISKRKKMEEALKKRNEELEKFNKLAVGRELKMFKLKRRVKYLEGRLGKRKGTN